MFSGKQICFGFLVTFYYNFWVSQCLKFSWICIGNVALIILLFVLCTFLETWVGTVIFPNADLFHVSFYHTIEFLIKNMLMSFMALFMLVTIWSYFSNIIIWDMPFGWMFSFGLATEQPSVLIESTWYH